MAETLTELIARIKTDSTELEKGLTSAEKQTEASSKKMSDSLKQVGMAMAASGAAITAALGLMGKAAIDEEINIKRLATTINNSGTAYDNVKDSLEAVIAATQRKTGVADDEQRDILNRLILTTGDYATSLSLLPTVLDLAAAGEMDATTAATYLGKAHNELAEGAEEVSVRFGQASLKFKSMEDIQNRVAGAAENLANPLDVLNASVGDVAEAIGMNLVPMMKGAVDWIVDIAIKIQEWVNENPKLAKTLTIVAAALGVVLTVVGGLILIMPTLISGVAAFGVVFHAALGPIGLVSLAITALIAIGTALYLNWDKIVLFFKQAWSNIKVFFLQGVDNILASLEKFTSFIPVLGDKVAEAHAKISSMIEAEKLHKDAIDATAALQEVNEALEDNIEITNNHTESVDLDTDALESNTKQLKEQQRELESTSEKVKRAIEQYQYERSEAGKLRITVDNVITSLYLMGRTNEDITNTLVKLGDEQDNVLAVMHAFGLSALEVAEAVGVETDALNELKDAYSEVKDSASKSTNPYHAADEAMTDAERQANQDESMAHYLAKRVGTGSVLSRLIPDKQLEADKVYTVQDLLNMGIASLDVADILGELFYVPEYAKGGTVSGSIGQPQLAMVHGGETIIPANESIGNVTVNFTQPVFFDREDTMNKFVDMIRKGIQRQDRLRFGQSYNGG